MTLKTIPKHPTTLLFSKKLGFLEGALASLFRSLPLVPILVLSSSPARPLTAASRV
ncbi:hypothetical protein CXB51_019970 [Gossypium anomalum]|uniref:Uncharacterized protein n=1 Tax=Gossypium anomalum TaxID=47600 RepID=A0A8J6CWZ2_9ROSI|nr:hypothetical protein CXB51_019970 [Gossypium anomalum]